MTDILSRIPSANEMPENAEPTRVGVKEDSRWSRRRVLGTVTGVTVAAGLGALDLLPWSKAKAADALYSGNCSGSWHKTDRSHWSGCHRYQYYPDTTSCAGRNAWRRKTGTKRKCSDGWYVWYDCTEPGQGNVTRFSICRTAI